MKEKTTFLVKMRKPALILGCYYAPDEIAGFTAAIARNLVHSGLAEYCDASGAAAEGPVPVTVKTKGAAELLLEADAARREALLSTIREATGSGD